jgi:hypothetical protein
MHRGDDGGPGCRIFGSGSPAISQLQRGSLPSKASSGVMSAACHRAVLAAGMVEIRRTYVYFFLMFLDLSVRNDASI